MFDDDAPNSEKVLLVPGVGSQEALQLRQLYEHKDSGSFSVPKRRDGESLLFSFFYLPRIPLIFNSLLDVQDAYIAGDVINELREPENRNYCYARDNDYGYTSLLHHDDCLIKGSAHEVANQPGT